MSQEIASLVHLPPSVTLSLFNDIKAKVLEMGRLDRQHSGVTIRPYEFSSETELPHLIDRGRQRFLIMMGVNEMVLFGLVR